MAYNSIIYSLTLGALCPYLAFLLRSLVSNEVLALPREIANHAGRSLRLRDGDLIVLFNGQRR